MKLNNYSTPDKTLKAALAKFLVLDQNLLQYNYILVRVNNKKLEFPLRKEVEVTDISKFRSSIGVLRVCDNTSHINSKQKTQMDLALNYCEVLASFKYKENGTREELIEEYLTNGTKKLTIGNKGDNRYKYMIPFKTKDYVDLFGQEPQFKPVWYLSESDRWEREDIEVYAIVEDTHRSREYQVDKKEILDLMLEF